MHIGLIGGIGPAATEFYYRRLVRARAGASRPLELTIAHADMATLLGNLSAGTPGPQAEIFARHAAQLAAAGAEAVAVTSIAAHFCIQELESRSPVPVVSALTALREALVQRRVERVGLLGARAAVESRLYGALSGLDVVLPGDDDLGAVSAEYLAMASAQRATEAQRALFFSVGADLCTGQGAEAVVLAGTDMFLAFEGRAPGFETIDGAEIHIEALARLA